mmetsp:Transcript_34455/g.77697  ORF Transcript_34455/g.77697 Transcript_34455/m.77697 type:complete len:174 (-) Transcript_34455:1476-1997(-)
MHGEATLALLVNNAAVGQPDRLQDVCLHDWEQALAVNVTAPLFLSQQLLPLLEKAEGGGRILNIGSGIADRVQLGTGTYGITKKALHRLSLQMAEDLRGRNVHVAYARLGTVDTPGLRCHIAAARGKDLAHADWLQATIDQGRAASAREVGRRLADLLLEETNETFGQEVTVK